jgi:hypothetical protein
MHIKLTNNIPVQYTLGQLRRDNPQTSFPKNIPDSLLAEYDVYPVQASLYPSVDHTKNVTEGTPVLIDGVWTQVWEIADATQEEINQRIEDQWNNIREKRDSLLTESDWTQVLDSPVNREEWSNYRQVLRDIPQEQTDPFEIIWPNAPGI